MAVQRVTSFGLQQSLLGGSNRVLNTLVDLQRQLSSGYKASSFADLGIGQAEILANIDGKIQRAQRYQDNNTLVISRMQNTSKALDNILETATRISTAIIQRRNGASGQSLPFAQQMEGFKEMLAGGLNANIEGRYLFSGSRTNMPPVKDPIPETAIVGTPDAGYYQGSNDDVAVLIQDGYSVTYNVRADHSAFQKLFAGVFESLSSDAAMDQEGLKHAYDLVQQGIQDLTALQAQVNTNIVSVQDVSEQHESLSLYWKGVSEEMSKTDVVAVSTQLALNESTLIASYQAYARISALRLTDYLR